MLKLLKSMRRKEIIMALICIVLIVGQVYFDLRLPDYMTDLTSLIKTSGSTGDILNVGLKMLGCTAVSAVLAIACGFLAAKTASGFSYAVRGKLFHHIMDIGSEEMQDFSVPSLITRTTNDITQIQMVISMGLQMIIKAPIMAVWAVIKILGKSWELSAVTAGFVVVLCGTVLAIMATCIPRFRLVQKMTDRINRAARETLTGIFPDFRVAFRLTRKGVQRVSIEDGSYSCIGDESLCQGSRIVCISHSRSDDERIVAVFKL